ncbi:hypothetical protein BTO09_13345 [Gilvibacter sp. SZ-19]|uniref:DUF2306 domain-containing protein n=1 Tax=Gilvibacter sp. SZ-19 TaxID=754429 RepID=UPI000B3CAA3C|nr:DUF2306 domain-containing protein [Gilvibacter sp. SZ-19]ARV13263.1 hypothetical protein BTO09_13345 [Gilvibacter sp. SZ-19]
MENYISGTVGAIHLLTAVIALIAGTAVLLLKKGTRTHKRWGYLYVIAMIPMLVTSFMLYNLFGHFGIFHFAAIVSGLTLIGGMLPIMTKRPKTNWMAYHFSFMYWSVLGLYGAFFSELFTRIPETPFFGMVAIATGMVFGIGGYVFKKQKAIWFSRFVS